MPEQFATWNRVHGAPFGRSSRCATLRRRCLPASVWERLRGPFALQPNNDTRAFEYPWAYYAATPRPGMKVVEIGGGLAGFQLVLDRAGCAVVNVDPGLEANGVGWPCDEGSMRKLNARFGTRVDLRPTVAGRADLDSDSYDRVFSISVLEHLPEDDIREVMACAFRWLKPGGLMIMTVDLALNLHPFCSRRANEYGCNQDLHEIVTQQPFEMVYGNPARIAMLSSGYCRTSGRRSHSSCPRRNLRWWAGGASPPGRPTPRARSVSPALSRTSPACSVAGSCRSP
jgi:2-polyprenyl-3-methyl-5-hydroxy-6-metoxy-1,4-benzoquinol methylase